MVGAEHAPTMQHQYYNTTEVTFFGGNVANVSELPRCQVLGYGPAAGC